MQTPLTNDWKQLARSIALYAILCTVHVCIRSLSSGSLRRTISARAQQDIIFFVRLTSVPPKATSAAESGRTPDHYMCASVRRSVSAFKSYECICSQRKRKNICLFHWVLFSNGIIHRSAAIVEFVDQHFSYITFIHKSSNIQTVLEQCSAVPWLSNILWMNICRGKWNNYSID